MKQYNHRLPAEWEATDAVLMAWPHADTDWEYMLDEVRRCYAAIIAAIVPRARVILIGPEEPDESYLPMGPARDNVIFIHMPTNDTWTRDYGPVTTERTDSDGESRRMVFKDFKFNGWGLKFASDLDNLATSHLYDTGLLNGDRDNQLNTVLEGGSIECDGRGTLLTTASCLLSPNRNGAWSRAQIEEYLKEQFGLDRVLWLDNGELNGDDTDGHIDTLARFAPEGDIIFHDSCAHQDDPHYGPLQAMRRELEALRTAEGRPYHLVELPIPDPVCDPESGERLPATYANFLYLNGAVLLPVYGQPMNDLEAKMTLARWLPGYEIIPVNCLALVRQHGSLHCATMQLPQGSII